VSIRWNDFILDEFLGPILSFEESSPVSRAGIGASGNSVMEDAAGDSGQIQETRIGERPARMVGQPNLDSTQNPLSSGMEADRGDRILSRWQREGS
jgi:hypothetical protein